MAICKFNWTRAVVVEATLNCTALLCNLDRKGSGNDKSKNVRFDLVFSDLASLCSSGTNPHQEHSPSIASGRRSQQWAQSTGDCSFSSSSQLITRFCQVSEKIAPFVWPSSSTSAYVWSSSYANGNRMKWGKGSKIRLAIADRLNWMQRAKGNKQKGVKEANEEKDSVCSLDSKRVVDMLSLARRVSFDEPTVNCELSSEVWRLPLAHLFCLIRAGKSKDTQIRRALQLIH